MDPGGPRGDHGVQLVLAHHSVDTLGAAEPLAFGQRVQVRFVAERTLRLGPSHDFLAEIGHLPGGVLFIERDHVFELIGCRDPEAVDEYFTLQALKNAEAAFPFKAMLFARRNERTGTYEFTAGTDRSRIAGTVRAARSCIRSPTRTTPSTIPSDPRLSTAVSVGAKSQVER